MNEYEEILQTLYSFHNKKVDSKSIKALRFKIESLFTKHHLGIIALKNKNISLMKSRNFWQSQFNEMCNLQGESQ